MVWLKLIFIWLAGIALETTWAKDSTDLPTFPIKDLTKMLLKRYKRMGPGLPITKMDEAVEVKFGASLQQIIEVDLQHELFTAVYWFNYEWKDPGLSWNESAHSGISAIRVSPDDIYVPDILPYNVVPGKYDVIRTPVVVYSTGLVNWVPLATVTSSCSAPDEEYTDELTCSIKFGSWTFDGSKLNVTTMSTSVDTSTYTANQNWDLLDAPAIRTVKRYACCEEPYIDITMKFHLRRL